MNEQMRSCIDACYACAIACDECAVSCLKEEDFPHLARCIQLDMDCADMCRLAMAYMGRDSELVNLVCQTCAQVCEACADECGQHNAMEHCEACEEACRQCAEECRKLLASPRGTPPASRLSVRMAAPLWPPVQVLPISTWATATTAS